MIYETAARKEIEAGGKCFIFGGMSLGVKQSFSQIALQARDLFLLRFIGHGGPGMQSLGLGAGGWDEMVEGKKVWHSLTGPDPDSWLYSKTLNRLSFELQSIRGVFGPYGSVELRGCHVAQGATGHRFLKELAHQLGVPVSAGLGKQHAEKVFGFTGPTFTAVPKGTLKTWCAALPDFPKMSVP